MEFNRYSNIFIQENAFENVVCEMASILSRPQCVNSLAPGRCGCNFRSVISRPILGVTGPLCGQFAGHR